jgi:hypothetical protein
MTSRRTLLALVTALALSVAACGGDDDDSGDGTTVPGGVMTTEAGDTTTTVPAEESVARVYFLDTDAQLATGARSVAGSSGDEIALAALDAVVAGPEDLETELGWSSAIPDGTEVLGLDIDGGVATVDLSGAFDDGGGSASMLGRVAQVVFTLTQFEGIESVSFALDGEPVDAIGGEGVGAVEVSRDDLTAVLPAIFVESPTPGEEITSPVTISGLSNTFEATIQYNVTDGEGLIVAEGFHTGGGTTGSWLPFEFDVEFEPERSGMGAVILFEISAADGSRVNLVEIPVNV